MSNDSGRIDTVLDPPTVAAKRAGQAAGRDDTAPGLGPGGEVATGTGLRSTRPPADAFALRGVRSPLVGRDAALSAMTDVIERALEFRAPQLITILGNQGTGKSRLLDELTTLVKLPTRVLRGQAKRSGGRYGALASLLRSRFHIADGDPRETSSAAFRRQVEAVFGDQRMAEVLHFLGDYIDLPFPASPFVRVLGENPEQHEEISRTVLRRFIELDAEKSPVVIVLDDLQWADDDSLDVLRELGAGLGGSPVVLIACGRPELVVRFSDWGGGTTDHLRVDLRNLEADDAELMLRNLLSRCHTVPEEIVDDAVEMTGGNPYFLEQLVRLFLANGTIDATEPRWTIDTDRAADTELPISIEEAIEARIAALESGERDVLEKGAVFGNVFWAGAVVALSRLENEERVRGELGDEPSTVDQTEPTPIVSAADKPPLELEWGGAGEPVRARVMETINELVERDYLLRMDAEDSTIAGDIELVFKHNLERELIAKSTDARRLERYHWMAAQWFETKLSDRSEEQLEFLAQLYDRGRDRRRAAHCYLAGARKAGQRYANEQAVELYNKGLSMLDDHDAAQWLEALHDSGSVLDLVGQTEHAERRFQQMLQRAWLFDNKAKGGAAHGRLGRICRGRGDYDRAMAHLRTAHDLFTQAGDRRGIAGTLDDIGKVHWLRGAYGQALEYYRQGLSYRRAIGDRRSVALSLANIGRVHHDSGAFKAAHGQFREALDLRRDIGDMSGVVQSLCDLGSAHSADGNHEMALELFTEAQTIANQIGEKLAQTAALSELGACLAAMGRGPEAVEHLMEAISLAAQLGHRAGLAEAHRRIAEVHLTMGDAQQGYDSAKHALKIAQAIGSRVQIGIAHRVLGEATAAAGIEPDQAERADGHYRTAVDVLAGMKNELDLAACYRSYSAFCARVGKHEDAAKLSRRAEEIFGRLRGATTFD